MINLKSSEHYKSIPDPIEPGFDLTPGKGRLLKAEQVKSAYIWLARWYVAEVGLSKLVGVKTPVKEFIYHRLLSLVMRARGQLQL